MTVGRDDEETVADLAELILLIARKIQMHGLSSPGIVALRPLDSLVMSHIGRNPGINPTRIAAEMGLKSSNVSAALRSLEAKGLIDRTPDPVDARGMRLSPTPAAWENRRIIRGEWARILHDLVEDDSRIHATTALLSDIDARLTAS